MLRKEYHILYLLIQFFTLVYCYEAKLLKDENTENIYVIRIPKSQRVEPHISRPRFNGKRTIENENFKKLTYLNDAYESIKDESNADILNRRVVVFVNDENDDQMDNSYNEDQIDNSYYDNKDKKQTDIWGRRHRYQLQKPIYEIEEAEENEELESNEEGTDEKYENQHRHHLLPRRFGSRDTKEAEEATENEVDDESYSKYTKKSYHPRFNGPGRRPETHGKKEINEEKNNEMFVSEEEKRNKESRPRTRFFQGKAKKDKEVNDNIEELYVIENDDSDTGKIAKRKYVERSPSYFPTIKIGDHRARHYKRLASKDDKKNQREMRSEVKYMVIRKEQ